MLQYALLFLILAILCGVLGFSALAGAVALCAKVGFVLFLFLFLFTLLFGATRQ